MRTYIITTWEALELLEEVLKKHFSEEMENPNIYSKDIATAIYTKLISSDNYNEIRKRSSIKVSKEIAHKIVNTGGEEKSNKMQFSKLIYDTFQNIRKHLDSHLSERQLLGLLNYLNKSEESSKYLHNRLFDPKYIFRNGLKGSKWIVYTWDYGLDEDMVKVSGLRRSTMKFINLFRVELETFRNREQKVELYKGDYIFVGNYKYIKLRFLTSFEHNDREDDIIFLFRVGATSKDTTLLVGQYYSLESSSVESGRVIMEKITNTEALETSAAFTTNPSEWNIDKSIVSYFKEKADNHLKSPEREITSLGQFHEWLSNWK